MKKIIAILMATAIATASFAGCTKETPVEENKVEHGNAANSIKVNIDDLASIHAAIAEKTGVEETGTTVIADIDGYKLTLAEYEYLYFTYLNSALQYAAYYGFDALEDEEFLNSTKEMFASEIKTSPIVLKMASEKGITITEEEFNNDVLGSYDTMKEEYGEEFETILASEATPSVNTILYYNYIFKLYDKILATYSDTEALETTLANDYIRAKHILIQFPTNEDGSEVTDEQKAEALAKAEEVYEKAISGEDFDALITEYNEDPGMEYNSDGYFFTYNEMVPEFEQAAFALEDNGISEIVETTYGYHIIKKMPVDDAFKTTEAYTQVYDSLVGDSAFEEFYNDMQASADALTQTNVENYDELIAPVLEEAQKLYNEYKELYNSANSSSEEVAE